MIDEAQIREWVAKHIPNPADRRQIANAMTRLRSPVHVREAQAYLLFLVNGRRSRGYILYFLRAAQRLGLQCPDGRLIDATPQQVLAWNNTLRYPFILPRVGKPWPKDDEGAWEDCTHETREYHRDVLLRFFRHGYLAAGATPEQAQRRAHALVAPPEAVPLPRAPRMARPDPRPEDWLKLLHALEQRPFQLEAIRDMWRFVLRVLMTEGNRAPALVNARLSHLKLELESSQARIEKVRGPRNKPNPTLRLDESARAAGAVWAKSHPFKDQDDPPLLISPDAASKGVCNPTNGQAIHAFLSRLGNRAELTFTVGTRAFRYYGHDEQATAGRSKHEMDLKFGRRRSSEESHRYVRFSEWRVKELMRRVRGLQDNERRCPGCRRVLDAGDPTCTTVNCPHAGTSPAVNNTELLGDLGITLHNLETKGVRS
ncbi:MAG: hypothetical protein ACYC2H_10410 [Thermoplasmatota archaeon]